MRDYNFSTPDSLPETGQHVRFLVIPDDPALIRAVSGLLSELLHEHNWEQVGAVSIDDTIQAMEALYDTFLIEQPPF